MKLLANENIPRMAVELLRGAGQDVVAVAEQSPSTADEDVLALAIRESRVLVTFDKDFGELVFNRGLPADCGVILLRIPPVPARVADRLARALSGGHAGPGKFVVIEHDRVRERPMRPPRG